MAYYMLYSVKYPPGLLYASVKVSPWPTVSYSVKYPSLAY